MIVEELDAYTEAHYAFEKLENHYEETFKKYTELKEELTKVSNSPQESYGFFTKVSKEEKIKELQARITHFSAASAIEERLLGLVMDQILAIQIPAIKQRKRERFDYIIKEFSKIKVQQLEKELVFWNYLADNEHSIGTGEELDSKLIRGQMRITKLPDVKIE